MPLQSELRHGTDKAWGYWHKRPGGKGAVEGCCILRLDDPGTQTSVILRLDDPGDGSSCIEPLSCQEE